MHNFRPETVIPTVVSVNVVRTRYVSYLPNMADDGNRILSKNSSAVS